MDLQDQPRAPRAVDLTNHRAREAVAAIIDRFTPWRLAIAQMSGRAQHSRVLEQVEREAMLKRCDEIASGIIEARTDLLIDLADAPTRVTAHSRVVDIERALDNLELGLEAARRTLTAQL